MNSSELKLCGSLRLQLFKEDDINFWWELLLCGWWEVFSFLFFCFFVIPLSSSISQCIYTRESTLAVRVMRISITAWSARCDSFITSRIMSLIAGVISTTFYNTMRWNKSCCNVWNMRWPDSVTDSMNIGGYQWGQLLRPSCSWQE